MKDTQDVSVDSTRGKLLAAGRTLFADKGIAATRISDISSLAGVNRERVYGYFGSKEGLFDAVLNEALDELAEAVPLIEGEDPSEYVGRVYDFHHAHPELLRLLLWEALHYRADPLPGEEARRSRYVSKASSLSGPLEATGSDLIGPAALFTLIGLGVWPHVLPQLGRTLGDTELLDPAATRERVVNFAKRGLTPR